MCQILFSNVGNRKANNTETLPWSLHPVAVTLSLCFFSNRPNLRTRRVMCLCHLSKGKQEFYMWSEEIHHLKHCSIIPPKHLLSA